MPIGAGIMGVAGLGGALIGSSAAKSAAKTQATAAGNAADLQLGMFNTIRDDLSPYRGVGGAALPGYMALLGIDPESQLPENMRGIDWNAYVNSSPDLLADYRSQLAGTPGLTTQQYGMRHFTDYGQGEGRATTLRAGYTLGVDPRQAFLESTPGYQFTRDQGIQAVTNSMAARGLGGTSGALGKGLARFVTGLADQTYQQQLQNYAGAVGTGQNAATQTGTFGQAATTGASNALLGGAQAQAAGTVGSANAWGGGLNTVANAYMANRLLGMYGAPAAA